MDDIRSQYELNSKPNDENDLEALREKAEIAFRRLRH